jgi:hypothetical protein
MSNEYEIYVYDSCDNGLSQFFGRVTKKNAIVYTSEIKDYAFDAFYDANEVVKSMEKK